MYLCLQTVDGLYYCDENGKFTKFYIDNVSRIIADNERGLLLMNDGKVYKYNIHKKKIGKCIEEDVIDFYYHDMVQVFLKADRKLYFRNVGTYHIKELCDEKILSMSGYDNVLVVVTMDREAFYVEWRNCTPWLLKNNYIAACYSIPIKNVISAKMGSSCDIILLTEDLSVYSIECPSRYDDDWEEIIGVGCKINKIPIEGIDAVYSSMHYNILVASNRVYTKNRYFDDQAVVVYIENVVDVLADPKVSNQIVYITSDGQVWDNTGNFIMEGAIPMNGNQRFKKTKSARN